MQNILRTSVIVLVLGLFVSACGGGGETSVVPSGTYEGTIEEVNAAESEIYVNTDEGTLELYFVDETELTRNGETVPFSTLEEGQKVSVTVEKVGKRLDPMKVEILE